MPQSKNCIISFANSKGRYVDGLARLSNSLRDNFEGDFVSFIGEASLGCEPHDTNPYSFKISAFRKVRDLGYQNVLWLDSSVFAIKNVNPVFDEIKQNGFIFQDAGHWLGAWSSDTALAYFGISRDEAMGLKCIGNAGLLGLSFSQELPNQFLDKWAASMEAGMFKGAWTNKDKSNGEDERILGHRHDLTCSSAIIHQMNLFHLAHDGDKLLQYAGIFDEIANEKIVFKAQGI